MTVDFKNSISDPIATDIGNKTTQGMTVSKTVQFGLFTTNKNAVWAAKTQLQKQSYPFAFVSIPVNRDMFRLQVGDPFKYTYAKYSISEAIYRVLQIEEDSLKSEVITIHAMEDVFGITNVTTEYAAPENNAIEKPDYTSIPIVYQDVIEAPNIVLGDTIGIIPIVVRSDDKQIGYILYMSDDDGDSYNSIGSFQTFAAYGTLVREYTSDTYQIDNLGFTVDFVNDDIDLYETITRQEMLGIKNLAVMGTEFMTIQTITPDGDVDGRYHLSGIYRGRFDTEKEDHAIGSEFYLINGENLEYNVDNGLQYGTSRKFKFVPYNNKVTGSIADSAVIDLTIASESGKPYDLINFKANGNKSDPVYYDDVDLTWSPRVRGDGAGFYAPTTTDKYPAWEGYFKIEVYVSSVLVRTKEKVDDISWTYTEAMNLADNTNLANEITFKITNFIEYEEWPLAESAQKEITVRLGGDNG